MAMELYSCNTFAELADAVVKASKLPGADGDPAFVEVYGHYEDIKEVLKALIKRGADIGCILELEENEVSFYDREFVLAFVDNAVAVEKVWFKHKDTDEWDYLFAEPDYAFVFGDCNSKLLKNIDSEHVIEVEVGGEEKAPEPAKKVEKAEESERETKKEAKEPEKRESDKSKAVVLYHIPSYWRAMDLFDRLWDTWLW